MQTRTRDTFATIRTEGGLLPSDLLQRILDPHDRDVPGKSPDAYHLAKGERINEAAARAWTRLAGAWSSFGSEREKLPEGDLGTTLTRERWLLILFQELVYGRLRARDRSFEVDGKSYAISHSWGQSPIHLVGCNVDLDRRAAGVAGAARTSPHSLVQEFLNRSDEHLWGFVSNGLRLRVLRDNVSMTRQAYVEFDLESMMDGEVYSDFVLLWMLCHQSRVEADVPEECWLEKWTQTAREQGTRALEGLRQGVQDAITALGEGFLAHPGNHDLKERLRSGELSTQEYYHQVLRLVYRLLFLLVAEDRGLLLIPDAPASRGELYTGHYSTSRLRRLALSSRGTRHADLYRGLRVVMNALGNDSGCPELGLPALGSFLWSEEAILDLSSADIANRELLGAIRELTLTEEGGLRRQVDYRNLGPEELGSVYESLLELHPDIDVEAAKFVLDVAAGHERKSTGSYYTPESLVQCLLDSALDPVVDQAAQNDDPERALLSLKICDPACGSGHFLLAAAHRISKRLAAIRTGDEEPSPEATRTALRGVIGHCLYGVDVNPMAVELCKVSLWMEALEPGKPLSFLDHRIQCGNSLLGATPALIEGGIPDDAFKPIEGDEKAFTSALKKQNRQERQGQTSLFADLLAETSATYSSLTGAIQELDQVSDESIDGIRSKEERFRELTAAVEVERAKLVSDAWCAAFVWPKRSGAPPAVTQDVLKRLAAGDVQVPGPTLRQVNVLSKHHRFFHWRLAFPDVYGLSAPQGRELRSAERTGGFDVVVGNPPFVNAIEGGITPTTKHLCRFLHKHVRGAADLAFYFLSLGVSLVGPQGRLGFIQPRAVLNAPSVGHLRSSLRVGLSPNMIYAPDRSDFFSGVAVFVCLLVLGPDSECLVSTDDDPLSAAWERRAINQPNWWAALAEPSVADEVLGPGEGVPLGEVFEVSASMTTENAYDVKPFVVDSNGGPGQKLVTTGLIDPGVCYWGEQVCRYLKDDYRFPRVLETDGLTKNLKKRLARSRRPKILVAGLSKRIECFVDEDGEYVGAVSTFTILHPDDNLRALRDLFRVLNAEEATDRLRIELGGNAMGGGSITIKKSFLVQLRVPDVIRET